MKKSDNILIRAIMPLAMLLLFDTTVNAQLFAENLLKEEVIKLLQADGTLLKDSEKTCEGNCSNVGLWRNNRKKEKWLIRDEELKTNLLRNFSPPSFCTGKVINGSLIFKDKSIGLIGSFIIRNNNFDTINTTTQTPLPFLKTGNHLSVFNPSKNNSNYLLNYTSNNLFKGGLSSQASSEFQSYYSAKLTSNISMSNSSRSQISIGAGKFSNQLGLICDKIRNGNPNALEFELAYYLWVEHRKGNIDKNDRIIYSFDGLCIYSSVGVQKTDIEEFTSEMNSSGKYPFLSYGINANAQWQKGADNTMQDNSYHIYMFAPPALTNIPSVKEIISSWNNLIPKSNAVKFTPTNNIPANSPLIGKIIFGPVANEEILPLIKIDDNYTISKLPPNNKFINGIKLINNDPNRYINLGNGYYSFEIEITRNESVISANTSITGQITYADIPFRIFIDNPIGSDTLDIIYDRIRIQTELYPTPAIDSFEVTPTKTTANYNYSERIEFMNGNSAVNVINTPFPPHITEVYGLPSDIAEKFKNNIKNASFKNIKNNIYDFSFQIPQNNNYFDINHRSHEIEVVIDFNGSNGTKYRKKLPLKLIGPHDMYGSSSTVPNILIKDNEQLLTTLDRSAFVNFNQTIKQLIDAKTDSSGVLDITGLVEELKLANKLVINPESGYWINALLIDKKRLY